MSCPLEIALIGIRKVIGSLQGGRVRSDTRFRRWTSLDAQSLKGRIDRECFLVLRINPLVSSPMFSPFTRDFLNPFLSFTSSFTFGSLQLLIELRRQIFSSISEL